MNVRFPHAIIVWHARDSIVARCYDLTRITVTKVARHRGVVVAKWTEPSANRMLAPRVEGVDAVEVGAVDGARSEGAPKDSKDRNRRTRTRWGIGPGANRRCDETHLFTHLPELVPAGILDQQQRAEVPSVISATLRLTRKPMMPWYVRSAGGRPTLKYGLALGT